MISAKFMTYKNLGDYTQFTGLNIMGLNHLYQEPKKKPLWSETYFNAQNFNLDNFINSETGFADFDVLL